MEQLEYLEVLVMILFDRSWKVEEVGLVGLEYLRNKRARRG